MPTINNIFSNTNYIQSSGNVQKVRYNREHLITKDVADELNTYLNFGVFPAFVDTKFAEYDKTNKYKRTAKSSECGTPGVRSLFNRAGTVLLGSDDGKYNVDIANDAHYWRISNNVPLMDSPNNRKRIRQTSGCTIKELVNDSSNGLMGRATYAYSDFMYCKHLGKVPNNYMITLRRFPLPVDDFIGAIGLEAKDREINSSNNASCIGCMITWMGVSGNDLGSLLKYNFKMPFKIQQSERQELKNDADSGGSLSSMFSMFDDTYRQQYQDGYAGGGTDAAFNFFGMKDVTGGGAPYKDNAKFEDRNKVYGPVDSIRETYIRDDAGLTFNQKLTLVFEYEIKSYNGINGKQAMLDLISNILNVTYTTGTFWGGGYKGFAAHQSNLFTNLNIFKARGGFTNFIEAFSEDLSTVGKSLGAKFKDDSGEFSFKKIFQELNNIGGMLMSGLLNKLGRPQKARYNSLLSPAPIGFWHVTIGNPKRPIMSMGNMIITDCSIEHNGPLGIDDFPTGLKVTVQLDRGKPRDLRDIEKLYMQGNDRIYSSMGDKVFDMYKNAELYQKHKKSNTLSEYNPITSKATPDTDPDYTNITLNGSTTVGYNMKKYFGTDDVFSIFIPAAEQEYGAGKKKPSTAANKSISNKFGENK